MPWADFPTFETAFKAHFCAVDDEQAAIVELVKVCKASHKLGTVKEYTAEFNLSVALQYTIWILLYLFMPDYPSSNPSGLNYFKMLWSMLIMLTKHPVLVQGESAKRSPQEIDHPC